MNFRLHTYIDATSAIACFSRFLVIFHNKTKNDITAATLTQLLYESERKAKTQPSVNLLKAIIRSGDGSFSGFIAERMKSELSAIEAEAASLSAASSTATVSNPPSINQ